MALKQGAGPSLKHLFHCECPSQIGTHIFRVDHLITFLNPSRSSSCPNYISKLLGKSVLSIPCDEWIGIPGCGYCCRQVVLTHLLIVFGQGIMGRVEWMLSKSWLPRKVSASPIRTKSTAMPGRRASTDSCASSESGFPKPEWWSASAKAWLCEASWAPCGAWASWASSHSLEGKFFLSPPPHLFPPHTYTQILAHTSLISQNWTLKGMRCAALCWTFVLDLVEGGAIVIFLLDQSRAVDDEITRLFQKKVGNCCQTV